jgi:hypothetical protein
MTPAPATPPPRALPALPSIGKVPPDLARIIVALANADADRDSTRGNERQNERSADDQLAACRAHALAQGWTVVVELKDEAISGALMVNRPAINALMAMADAGGFDVLLDRGRGPHRPQPRAPGPRLQPPAGRRHPLGDAVHRARSS